MINLLEFLQSNVRGCYDYLLEGQIDGLKNVTKIRHYTTGAALKSILNNGYIEARESVGDDDWKDYDLFDKKVVSFHDVRTDPEWDEIIDSNNHKRSIEGLTPTLALHMKKICACIEIDYDKLDQLIQDKTHLLNIYGKKAEEFVNQWNYIVNRTTLDDENSMVTYYKCKLDFTKFVKDTIEKNDEELLNSLKFIWDEFNLYNKKDDPKGKLAFDKIYEIFLKYYPKEQLEKTVKDWAGRERIFFYDELAYYIGHGFGYGFPSINHVEYCMKDLQKHSSFYQRTNLKEFTEKETQQLVDYVIKFDVLNIIKMMRNHGWRYGDSNLHDIFVYRRLQSQSGEYFDGQLMTWIDDLMNNKKTRIVNANIEIRIGSNVELNKENCKIIIFDGICDATNQSSLKKLPAKYYKKYNIEHIEPNTI